jgi:hypothetical protein
MTPCLKLIPDRHDTGQLKLMNSAMKEMRYAYRVFNRYQGHRKVRSSARPARRRTSGLRAPRGLQREMASTDGWSSPAPATAS